MSPIVPPLIDIKERREDPLRRIQEEINEVVRRERELRAAATRIQSPKSPVVALADDSGISTTSSSPVNGAPAEEEDKSSGPKSAQPFNRTPTAFTFVPRNQTNLHQGPRIPEMLTRTMSTPQIFQPTPNQRRGLMQRFIASRGRMNANQQTFPVDKKINNGPPILISPTAKTSPPVIERDQNGRPIRRGYVPVEEKIQKELREMKNREVELKQLRKLSHLRASNPDLLDEGEDFDIDDGSDRDEESGSFGKMNGAKSISELCDSLTSSSLSPRNTPSPKLDGHNHTKLRPALSLAQLCDVDPTEAPSAPCLIAQWEDFIMKKRRKNI
uniref:A-kinase anchor protein 2 C-terminal domain-containing protein n=1 Tax=Phlebotomus papatasi TaxID=29031 RepID=A0A1B0DRD5_PHLPP